MFDRHILFTGAGFTANFGGPLGSEVWTRLVTHKAIQLRPRLRELLLTDGFDFESTIAKVRIGDDWDILDRRALQSALESVYAEIDLSTSSGNIGPNRPFPIELIRVQQDLVGRFSRRHGGSSLFFTLNQDIFIERMQFNGCRLHLPGIENSPTWFTTQAANQQRGIPPSIELPSKLSDTEIRDWTSRKRSLYIKLHGSWGWNSGVDASSSMVLGTGKIELIRKEPLLNAYFQIFSQAMTMQETRILVIGYGFRDEHINQLFRRAAEDHGAKFWIITPQQPSSLKDQLEKSSMGSIWKALGGYLCANLNQVFPAGAEPSPAWESFSNSYWDN